MRKDTNCANEVRESEIRAVFDMLGLGTSEARAKYTDLEKLGQEDEQADDKRLDIRYGNSTEIQL